jgi:4-diphosphocytidyl-2-C-methyl-D-erythritol kinase
LPGCWRFKLDVLNTMTAAASEAIATQRPASATASACAKINLTLEVLGSRDDGYHELRSLVIGVDLRDEIRCATRHENGVALSCSDPALDSDDNLVSLAARELAAYRDEELALSIALRKRIPVGGGLGGGSSDAAATLRLCDRLWNLGLDSAALAKVGARIGSDVPLFFSLPSAIITGRGEHVEPVALGWSGWVMLVFAGPGISTASVYREWNRSDGASEAGELYRPIIGAKTAKELSALVTNDLQPAVFRLSPAIAKIHDQLTRMGAGPLTVSGAGSTLFRLFDEKDEANRVAAMINEQELGVKISVVAAPVAQGPINMNEED